jgi:hypothetical protein
MHSYVLCRMAYPNMIIDDFRGHPDKAPLGSNAKYVTHRFASVGMRMCNQQVCLEKSGT